MYAKLENGIIRYAPKTVQWHGKTVNNPSTEKLLELGYLPITYTDMPDDAPDGKHYESGWEQTEDAIMQTWSLVDDPVYPEPEPTMSDLIDAIERGMNT